MALTVLFIFAKSEVLELPMKRFNNDLTPQYSFIETPYDFVYNLSRRRYQLELI